ncbi:MAG: restriction endonuclease subunit S, partial [bacterium]
KKFNAGSGVPTLNRNHLDEIDIEIPDLPTQSRIASVLSAYDDLIENNEKRIRALEEMAQLLYTEWFVKYNFSCNNNIETHCANVETHCNASLRRGRSNDNSSVSMIDSGTEYGIIPEGWEVRKLKEIGKVITGKTPPTNNLNNFNGEILFIKTPDIHGNIFVLGTEQTLSEIGMKTQSSKLLPEKTVFISCIGTLGVVGITSKPSQTNQQINSLLFNNKNDYIMFYFFAKSLKQKLVGLGSNGSTMGNVNKDKFENINILYPAEEVRNLFFEATENLFDEILSLQKQNNNLSKTRDLLIPQLVTGKRGGGKIMKKNSFGEESVKKYLMGYSDKFINDIIQTLNKAKAVVDLDLGALLDGLDFKPNDRQPEASESFLAELFSIFWLEKFGFKNIKPLPANKKLSPDFTASYNNKKFVIEVFCLTEEHEQKKSDLYNCYINFGPECESSKFSRDFYEKAKLKKRQLDSYDRIDESLDDNYQKILLCVSNSRSVNALSTEDNFKYFFKKLLDKLKWGNRYYFGILTLMLENREDPIGILDYTIYPELK